MAAEFSPLQSEVALRWLSVKGRTYTVEFKPAVNSGEGWEVLQGNIAGSGEALEVTDQVQPASRFYRLGVAQS